MAKKIKQWLLGIYSLRRYAPCRDLYVCGSQFSTYQYIGFSGKHYEHIIYSPTIFLVVPNAIALKFHLFNFATHKAAPQPTGRFKPMISLKITTAHP
jgi:hypothetical protein